MQNRDSRSVGHCGAYPTNSRKWPVSEGEPANEMFFLDGAKPPTINCRPVAVVADSEKFICLELPNTVGSQINEVVWETHQAFDQHFVVVGEGNNVAEARRASACYYVVTSEQGGSH